MIDSILWENFYFPLFVGLILLLVSKILDSMDK